MHCQSNPYVHKGIARVRVLRLCASEENSACVKPACFSMLPMLSMLSMLSMPAMLDMVHMYTICVINAI